MGRKERASPLLPPLFVVGGALEGIGLLLTRFRGIVFGLFLNHRCKMNDIEKSLLTNLFLHPLIMQHFKQALPKGNIYCIEEFVALNGIFCIPQT